MRAELIEDRVGADHVLGVAGWTKDGESCQKKNQGDRDEPMHPRETASARISAFARKEPVASVEALASLRG